MIKKGLRNIEVMDYKKINNSIGDSTLIVTGKIKVINNKKVLNVDYFDKNGLVMRGFYTNDDYCHLVNNKFTTKTIDKLLCYKWELLEEVGYYSKKDRENILKFFKSDNFINGIHTYARNIVIRKFHNSVKEEKKSIKTDLDNICDLPVDFIPWLRSKSPSHLFINKEGKCFCTNCKKKFKFSLKYKHLDKTECPKCGKDVTVQHLHRCKKMFNEVTWGIYHDYDKNDTEVIRYVCLKHQIVINKEENIVKAFFEECNELARAYNRDKRPCMEKIGRAWYYTARNYLSSRKGICNNSMFCGNGYLYPYNINSTFEKLGYNRLKLEEYVKSQGKEMWHYLFTAPKKRALFVEQLEKIKAYDVITTLMYKSDRHLEYDFDMESTSLKKFLKLNNEYFKLFTIYKTYDAYRFVMNLQNKSIHMSSEEMKEWISVFGFSNAEYVKKDVTVEKICKYISTQCKIANTDTIQGHNYMLTSYYHYRDILKTLNYPMKNIYKFPKDFYKTDKRVAEEYSEFVKKKSAEEKRKMEENYNTTINEISKAMRNSEDIQAFLQGTSGLLVKVPETAEELRAEGKRLGNCLASYVNSMANGDTTIFFIRKIDSPDKEYYAMEYKDGKVKQLHGVGNCIDKTGKVIAFADAFCKVLNNINFQPPKLNVA